MANRTRQRLPLARLRRTARDAAGALDFRIARLGILFVGNAAMRRLNAQYRKRSEPTNVLAFPAASPDVLRRQRVLWGDIVLCVPVARREARNARREFDAHLALLLVHAMVHLAGSTHGTEIAARRMERIERKIARMLDIGNGDKQARR